MSVLDTFYILFKSDAEDVEKGTKKAKGAVDDLESGISGADKTSISLGKKFNSLATKAVAAFAAVYSVTQLISSARGIAEQSSELGVLSDVLGESASELVNWGRAVQNMGGDSKAFQGSMRGLSSSLNDALVNGPNAATDALAKMGVGTRDAHGNMKTVLQILPDLAREMSGLTRESALARGKSLGLDTGTILLLMQGEDAVRRLVSRQREMNQVSDDEVDALRLLNARWNEFKNLMSDSGTEILTALLPALEKVGEGVRMFVDFLSEHQTEVLAFFKGVGVIVGVLAIKALILAAPFLLTVAAIAAMALGIGLLLDDVKKFVSGQDSALGDAAKRWEFVADGVELVRSGLEKVVELADKASNMLPKVKLPSIGGIFDKIDEGYKRLKGVDVEGLQGGLDGMSRTPLTAISAQGRAGGVSNRSSSVTVGELTIQTGASDPAAIAGAISGELENQLSNAVEQNDDGIAA